MTTSALAHVAIPPHSRLPAVLAQAVAVGGNETASTRADEQTFTPLGLLTHASNRMVDAAVCANAAQAYAQRLRRGGGDSYTRELVKVLRSSVAGAIRLSHRALEVHARNAGYVTSEWEHQALDHTLLLLEAARNPDEDEVPNPVGAVRAAAVSINRAIAATERDLMAVPAHIAEALGALLAVYLLAGDLLGR